LKVDKLYYPNVNMRISIFPSDLNQKARLVTTAEILAIRIDQ